MKRLFSSILLASALLSCGPDNSDLDSAADRTFLIYDYNADEHRYQLIESEIKTLQNTRTIDGEVAYLRGGGKVVLSLGDPQTEEEYLEAMTIENDQEPSGEYVVQEDGTVVPWDFDTQMMLTLYHHLERSSEFFDSLGFDVDRVGRMPVYYFPQMSLFGVQIPIFSDNAAYAYTLDAFLIPPRLILLEDVPLSANRGVIVHEYSHAVFNRIVYEDARVPRFLLENYPAVAVNDLRALDEGLADIFAGLATGDPDFIGPSISAELFAIDRDLEKDRVYDASLERTIQIANQNSPNPYILGSVVASTLWDLRGALGPEVLGQTVLAAMEAIADPGPDFRLSDFFNAFLDAAPSSQRNATCELFVARLPIISAQLNCP